MQPDELQAVRSAMNPPWDDLREQRVMRGALDTRKRRLRRRRIANIGAAGFVALAVLALVIGLGTRMHRTPAAAVASVSAVPATPAASVMTLADGSRVSAKPDADVRIETVEREEVRLSQRSGEVFYEVAPNPERKFIVRASNVTVRVKGTAFTVKVETDSVLVHVERGRVAVEDASGAAELGPGEELRRVMNAQAEAPAAASAAADAGAASKASTDAVVSIESLLEKADRARASGRLDEAASTLEEIVARFPKDRRVGSVLFTLGRVERSRGHHAKAASTFRACSHGPLAEDALAEEASAWQAAGQGGNAREAASRYLARFPNGPHAARMKKIAE